MSTEENKVLARRAYELFSTGDLAALEATIAPNFVDHNPSPGVPPNFEGVKQSIAMFRAGFPDLKFAVEDIIAEGDTVVSRLTVSGTNTGEFMGMPPTGKRFSISAVDIVRIIDGKATDRWGTSDDLSMLQQLGVIPPPGQAGA